MNNSFKFIVNSNNDEQVEITTLLQYCALKNILSKFNSNKIKPLKYNINPVLFSDKIIDDYPDASFTEYLQKEQSERDSFKTKTLKEDNVSLFFDALSNCEDSRFLTRRREILRKEYEDTAPNYYTVEDLCMIFMNHLSAKNYLSKYIIKNSEEICYAQMSGTAEDYVDIWYDDKCIAFDIINFKCKDKEDIREFTKLVNCINESFELQFSKNNGLIADTCDDLCVYTEDPTTIREVLSNNQRIIDTTRKYINYMECTSRGRYSHIFNISNELQSSITNVINSYESRKKKIKNNSTALDGLFI